MLFLRNLISRLEVEVLHYAEASDLIEGEESGILGDQHLFRENGRRATSTILGCRDDGIRAAP
jgi:hypothetical protein